MKDETKEEGLVERIKTQTEQLWNTIQEAKKSNLKVYVGFDDYLIKPEIEITKLVYSQSREIIERIKSFS